MTVDVPPAVDVPVAMDTSMVVDSGSDGRCLADMGARSGVESPR